MCDRVCTRCGETHPVTFFNKDCTRPDGIYPQCKNCSRKAGRKNYATHLDAHRELKQSWKDANRERHREINMIWRKTHPEKARAGTARWQAARRRATPPWVDKVELRAFHQARPPGHHIDHIEPLQGIDRCGLNVIWNLQYLPAVESFRKNNWTEAKQSYNGRL